MGSDPWLTAEECRNLNALFGVAYRERQRFSVSQLGYLGYQRCSRPSNSIANSADCCAGTGCLYLTSQ